MLDFVWFRNAVETLNLWHFHTMFGKRYDSKWLFFLVREYQGILRCFNVGKFSSNTNVLAFRYGGHFALCVITFYNFKCTLCLQPLEKRERWALSGFSIECFSIFASALWEVFQIWKVCMLNNIGCSIKIYQFLFFKVCNIDIPAFIVINRQKRLFRKMF